MFTQVFTSILILLILLIYYRVWVRPKRALKTYTKQLRELGYKVYETPYNPFKSHLIDIINKGIKQGDALKVYKEDYSEYDVIVANMLLDPKIEFKHIDFIKDFYAVDKHY